MTESLFHSFENAQDSPEAARATYLRLWLQLQQSDYPLAGVKASYAPELPSLNNDGGRRVYIPAAVISELSQNGQGKFNNLTKNAPKAAEELGVDNSQPRLSRNQIFQIIKQEEKNQREEEVTRRWEKFVALKSLFYIGLFASIAKLTEAESPYIPDFLRGHVVDTMAVPLGAVLGRLVLRNRKENFKIGIGMPLALVTAEEVGQMIGKIPGTGDPLDFVAYGAGALGYYLNRKRVEARDNRRRK